MSTRVDAHSSFGYDLWSARVGENMTESERRELRQAEDDIKFDVAIQTEAHGADALQEAFFGKVDGITLKEFLALGLNSRIERLTKEREHCAAALKYWKVAAANASENESMGRYRERINDSQDDLAAADLKLESAQRRLKELMNPQAAK
jgi:hypothetical protein